MGAVVVVVGPVPSEVVLSEEPDGTERRLHPETPLSVVHYTHILYIHDL